MSFSLVIPCYNEADNLPSLFEKCASLSNKGNCEIIFVDNGSTDKSQKIFNEALTQYNQFKCVRVECNIGYGNGIIEGLKSASKDYIGWTHADLQTDPNDVLIALNLIKKEKFPRNIFIKGKRYGRPLFDNIFTLGMSLFETLLLGKVMFDINAQPTLFHRDFFSSWENPPKDFSLDLYAYFLAKKNNYKIVRFNVFFGKRLFGISSWNFSTKSKLKFIKRTLSYSFELKKRMK